MATQQQFDNHAVWAALTEMRDFIEQNEAVSKIAGSNQIIDQIRYLATTALAHKNVADPAPYSLTAMANLQSYTSQILAELRNFSNTENPGHLDNAWTHTDSALNSLASWPVSIVRGGAATLAHQAFREYRDSANSAIAKLQEALTESDSNLQSIRENAEIALSEVTSKFAELQNLTAQLEERIAADEVRLSAALVSNNEAFLSSQQRHQEALDAWLTQQSEGLDTKTQPYMEALTETKQEAEKLLGNIELLHKSVEKTSSKAAAAILAKDYGSYSTREWTSGVIAYIAGFAALLWLASYLVGTISSLSSNFSPTWQYVALKIGLTATAAVAAGVAFQFGSNALSRANTNKRVQLELGTIGTFLSDVGDEDKVEKAKLDFVDRTFGRAWEPTIKKDGEKASENGSGFSISGDKLIDMINKLKQ